MLCTHYFLFFKQKTAYEMRISDWSSDVCSADLTTWEFQRPLEEYFTVVNYDQRGAGKTFLANDPDAVADTLHIERYVDDAIEIAEHVRARLGKDKLIVMAHSWGTVVGMGAALERPDLFHAYVGIGQVKIGRAHV